jgi:hypothetical protein
VLLEKKKKKLLQLANLIGPSQEKTKKRAKYLEAPQNICLYVNM